MEDLSKNYRYRKKWLIAHPYLTQDDETRWGSSQGALCGSVSQIILPRTCESKVERPQVYIMPPHELPGVLHGLRPSGGNGMGRAGCCQDWQVWSRLKIRIWTGSCQGDAWRDQPCSQQAWNNQRRLLYTGIDNNLSCVGNLSVILLPQVGRNICHGSDAVESAQHEIGLWFR